ncbi:MAG TPA: hypothetical protein VMT24_13805, partial [Aggregatilineaceae bacterium]|nr:hypothetical protein [Aggregatilineaceae bacterium]
KMGLGAPEWLDKVLGSSTDQDAAFPGLAKRLEKVLDPVFLRLFFYAALEKPELLRKRYGSSLGSLYNVLGRHIRDHIHSEALRDIDPTLVGQALVGMIAYRRLLSELLGGASPFKTSGEVSARICAEIGLFGTSSRRDRNGERRTEKLCVPAAAQGDGVSSGKARSLQPPAPQEIAPSVKRQ